MPLYTPISLRTGHHSASGSAPTSLDDFLARLGGRESSGSYTVKGIETKHGRALGKYQVMEEYLPDWSKQYLGRNVPEQEYLSNPRLQEQLVRNRVTDLYKQYGNWADVASVWHSGRPLAEAAKAGAKDGLGTTTASYVRDITGVGLAQSTPGKASLYVPIALRHATMGATA